ncbi:MAG: hypothetical protein JST80_13415 [Bdellovibrionales bacterium]|nr:hypothetical protein [Bdellovibrionales bacterium]
MKKTDSKQLELEAVKKMLELGVVDVCPELKILLNPTGTDSDIQIQNS